MRTLGVALVVAIVTAVVFAPALEFAFVNFDDPLYVTEEPRVHDGLTWESLRWALTGPHAKLWHPLTTLSHLLDVTMFGVTPRGAHAMNVVWHAITSALAVVAFRTLTGDIVLSALAALLFALHPLRVESVAWVAERKDVLSGAFGCATLVAYARWCRDPRPASRRLLTLVYSCGVMAKSTLVALPLGLLAVDIWPLGRLSTMRELRERVREKAPLWVGAAVASVLTFRAQWEGGAVADTMATPILARLSNAAVAVPRYLWMTLWPADLSVFYPWQLVPWSRALPTALVVALISVWVTRSAGRAPHRLAGWLWFGTMLLPVLGLVQAGQQAYADRFTYLPHVGLALATAAEGRHLASRSAVASYSLKAIAVVAIVATGLVTRRTLPVWRDSETLFRHALTVTERNYVAHLNLGHALAARGDDDAAFAEYQAAVGANPRYAMAYVNVANGWARRGNDARALEHYEKALALDPRQAVGWNGLGVLYAQTGRTTEALAAFERALAVTPTYPEANANLADALVATGQLARAVEHYRRAWASRPEWEDVPAKLSRALAGDGQLDAAATVVTRALARHPRAPFLHLELGNIRFQQGRAGEALPHYDTALAIQADLWEAHDNRATALATLGRLHDAIAAWDALLTGSPALPDDAHAAIVAKRERAVREAASALVRDGGRE